MLVRTTWATHPRSRNGADTSDGGRGTSRTIVRFILGQPRKGWERRIQTEMESKHRKITAFYALLIGVTEPSVQRYCHSTLS